MTFKRERVQEILAEEIPTDIDYKSLPPEEQRELAVQIYIDSQLNPKSTPLSQAKVAEMFGKSQRWVSDSLHNSGVLDKIEKRTRSNVILAQAMLQKAAPEIALKTIESARKERDEKFEYITQGDRRDILDRAGVRAEKQEASDVNITFTNGGFALGMPHSKGQNE